MRARTRRTVSRRRRRGGGGPWFYHSFNTPIDFITEKECPPHSQFTSVHVHCPPFSPNCNWSASALPRNFWKVLCLRTVGCWMIVSWSGQRHLVIPVNCCVGREPKAGRRSAPSPNRVPTILPQLLKVLCTVGRWMLDDSVRVRSASLGDTSQLLCRPV